MRGATRRREGAQHESAQTAEGTQKARGSARQERERTREAAGRGDVQRARRRFGLSPPISGSSFGTLL